MPVRIKIKTALLSLLASGRRLTARRNVLMFNGLVVPIIYFAYATGVRS